MTTQENKSKELLLSLKNVSAAYDKHEVLSDVCLNIYKNDFLGIIGPNGGGKTTLVKLILGLIEPTKGKIEYYREGNKGKSHPLIGYMPQYTTFDKKFPLSVREIVLSGLSSRHSLFHPFGQADYDKVDCVLDELDLTSLSKKAIGELSGGQRQRVLLARAIVSSPHLLILDEPNTYIDKPTERQLYDILGKINTHCAIILVSHDIGTVIQNVRNIACVSHTLHYHPTSEASEEWIERHLGCPFEMIAHGKFPHRILEQHQNSQTDNKV